MTVTISLFPQELSHLTFPEVFSQDLCKSSSEGSPESHAQWDQTVLLERDKAWMDKAVLKALSSISYCLLNRPGSQGTFITLPIPQLPRFTLYSSCN